MKNLILVSLIVIFLASCTPTATNAPIITDTPLGSLSGIIFLTNSTSDAIKPFAFGAKLRQTGGNEINGSIDTPKYNFENIAPGIYELWVLIPYTYVYLSNCFDIGLPNN